MVDSAQNIRVVGRYALHDAIASGGMATVHLGRLMGPVGFSRTVAIKRLHAQFASDPEFVSMFLDEARLAARIRHPNVVPTLDVVATDGELFLVMEYVPGESVARLARAVRARKELFPLRILSAVTTGALLGLHAAHEAKDERGAPLGIVHRDVSPQNVLVGVDGVPRVLDFGVAKAAGRMQTTKEGQIKGKLSYMPPEQLRGGGVSRQTDIYAAGVMLWELLVGERLFSGDSEGVVVTKVLEGVVEAPSRALARHRPGVPEQVMRTVESLDATVLRALAMSPNDRFATAREMALEVERLAPPATSSEAGDWVENIARQVLTSRAARIAEIESSGTHAAADPSHVMSVLQSQGEPRPPYHSYPGSTEPTLSAVQSTRQPASSPSLVTEGPPATQPSSISVSTAGRDDTVLNKRTAVAVFAGLVIGLGVVGAGLVWWYANVTTPKAANASSSLGADSDKKSQSPQRSDVEARKESVGVATRGAEPSREPDGGGATTTPTPVKTEATTKTSQGKPPATAGGATAGGATAGGATAGGATAKAAPAKPPPGGDCGIPFWYDAQGVKHYKPECIGK